MRGFWRIVEKKVMLDKLIIVIVCVGDLIIGVYCVVLWLLVGLIFFLVYGKRDIEVI